MKPCVVIRVIKTYLKNFKKKAKNKFYTSLLDQYQGNAKETWRIMKEITGKSKIKKIPFRK